MKIKIKIKTYNFEKFKSGSFTDLYKSDKANKKLLIFKIINDNYARKKSVLERFSLERKVLSDIKKSEFFPQLISKGEYLDKPYLTYEFIEGTPLITLLKTWDKKQFSPKICCDFLFQILTATSVLHNNSRPIVHSDISPENILISKGGIHIIDLGCAQYISDEQLASKWIGKPSYLSPEQARGEKWGIESDIYQIGVIFYECITGKKWNLGKTPNEKIAFASAPPRNNFKNTPLFLRPLLRSMLDVNKKNRLSNADECLKKLSIAVRAF